MAPIARPPPHRVGGPPKAQRRPRKNKAGGLSTIATCCDNPDPQEEDGVKICKNCFTELSNVNITAEVTFEDQAGGRSTVQGGLVGENARFSKTLGAGAYRRIGGGERNSMVEIENAGRRALAALAAPLKIPDNITQQAASVWSLAALNNFMAGRRTDEVAAACMWAACRRQKENDVMLMDMAEILRINVFRLGEVYKDLCEKLYLEGKPVGYQHFVEMEPLIKKYCQKLQFGDKTNQVGHDALRIMKRMNRDWIVSGRHPAGLCGACIILAARMNNFQRSVREVVYISKVADVTIAKRVEEFRRTKSAGLTIEEFRQFGNRMLYQHDPPSLYSAEEKNRRLDKKRAKRAEHIRQSLERQSILTISDDGTEGSPSPGLATPPPTQNANEDVNINPAISSIPLYQPPVAQMTIAPVAESADTQTRKRTPERETDDETGGPSKRPRNTPPPTAESSQNTSQSQPQPQPQPPSQPRLDADGFAIPALPTVDPDILSTDSAPTKRKRGRPPKNPLSSTSPSPSSKSSQPPTVIISEEELADENYLEEQISQFLEDGQVEDAQNEVLQLKEAERINSELERAKAIALEQQALDAAKSQERRAAEGIIFGAAPTSETVTAEELEKEFEHDFEVENCLLSPAEIQIKERIWVTHNEDWLRKQAEKEMMQLVAKATGFSASAAGGKRARKPKKKRGKIGDRSVLAEAETPIESPVDAAKAMLDRRAPQKSQHVDFSQLERIYARRTERNAEEESTEGTETRATSPVVDGDAADADAGDGEGGRERRRGGEREAQDGEEQQQEQNDAEQEGEEQAFDQDEEFDEEEEDPEEADYRRALTLGVPQEDEDEFGVVHGGDYGVEEEYDEYE